MFLLLRDDAPLAARLAGAEARARAIPRLLAQARRALESELPSRQARELFALSARQARAAEAFYRDGLLAAAQAPADAERLRAAGAEAAEALSAFAAFLAERGRIATAGPRLGADYARSFRLGTGVATPVDELLRGFEADLPGCGARRRPTAGASSPS